MTSNWAIAMHPFTLIIKISHNNRMKLEDVSPASSSRRKHTAAMQAALGEGSRCIAESQELHSKE